MGEVLFIAPNCLLGCAAMAEPKVRAVYEKMVEKKNKRPFDMAVSDYFKGNDLLSRK